MRPYGCNNDERPKPGSTYLVQYGWTPDGRRDMVSCTVMGSVGVCYYDEKAADPRCANCRWAQ